MSIENPGKDGASVPADSHRLGTVGYGVDDPRTILELAIAGVLSVIVGLLITSYTSESNPAIAATAILVGPGVGFLILVVATALYWSSRLGKFREMSRIVGNVPWGGEEVVLDLGCGRGLATVMAAKHLVTGYALGVDLWSKARISGNDPGSLMANAASEGVDSNVAGVKAFSAHLPLADKSVDVVLSALAFHHLVPKRQRGQLFSEVSRVLKDGGRIGILDAGNGNDYSRLLRQIGFRDVEMHRLRFTSFPPFHVVLARKPYGE